MYYDNDYVEAVADEFGALRVGQYKPGKLKLYYSYGTRMFLGICMSGSSSKVYLKGNSLFARLEFIRKVSCLTEKQ